MLSLMRQYKTDPSGSYSFTDVYEAYSAWKNKSYDDDVMKVIFHNMSLKKIITAQGLSVKSYMLITQPFVGTDDRKATLDSEEEDIIDKTGLCAILRQICVNPSITEEEALEVVEEIDTSISVDEAIVKYEDLLHIIHN
jgi:hypothetical protein